MITPRGVIYWKAVEASLARAEKGLDKVAAKLADDLDLPERQELLHAIAKIRAHRLRAERIADNHYLKLEYYLWD
jgi:hypothetical protein